jgi:23S rRNA (adenine2030-N6)-methyltransferase
MNYRHIYHAGNFADVFKHIVLMRVIAYLKQKDKPFFALDTHAGTGRYNLTSVQAQKTMEAAAGIGSLWGKADLPRRFWITCRWSKPSTRTARRWCNIPVLH